MNNKYFILFILIILCVSINQAQWYDVSGELPNGWATNSIDAFDSITAIGPINGYHTLYKTEDGGLSWEEIYRPSYCEIVSIADRDKFWFTNYSVSEIWGTKDGGSNWVLQFYDPSLTNFINYLEMFDTLNGVAMGDAPTPNDPALILRTTDGGETWESMNDDELIGCLSFNVWRAIDFVNLDIGYFFDWLDNPPKLYKTINGGKDWLVISDRLSCNMLKFYNSDIGLMQGGVCNDTICEPNLYRTTDGGQNWEYIFIDSMNYANDIEFIPGKPSDVWMIAGNKGFFSSDTGRTWTEELYIPAIEHRWGFRDMKFTDKNHGWLLGREPGISFIHHLYRTTNGGFGGLVYVESEKGNNITDSYFLSQNYPNPFNPTTTISYSILKNGMVIIKVFDILGTEVAELVNEVKEAGSYSVKFNASNLPSGIYFYSLNSGNFSQTKKLVLLK